MAFSSMTLLKSYLIFFLFNISYALKDSITLYQSITGSQHLTSKGGKFELGFFKPGKSPYYYLGIWYNLNLISNQTVVWIANRETPLTEISETTLAISENGNLVLSNQTNSNIWSTNITHNTPTTAAVLFDTGNLVLRDVSNPNVTLWESFDHPTHTWLPGAKLGLNKVTKELQRLTSWKNEDDPATGIFNLEIDPNGTSQYFIVWNNSFNFWSSGTWDGHIFSNLPQMNINTIYDTVYTSNDKENYLTFNLRKNSPLTPRFVMDLSGQVKQFVWEPNNKGWNQFWSIPIQQCDVYALCGPFGVCNANISPFCNCIKGFSENSPSDWALSDWAGGCVRNTKVECEKDRFYMMPTRMPINPKSARAGSASDCESYCLNNCSCNAYAYNSSGCFVWHGGLLNLQYGYFGPNKGTLFVRLPASELSTKNENKIVIIASVALLIIIVLLRSYCRIRTSRERNVVGGGLIAFRYNELQQATRNFTEKLGRGGFGSVFKGVLPDSSSIAVKQLEGVRQGEKQFRMEVSTIGMINHINLVRLRGFCSEGLHKLLVYEYMPNGSLDSKLFNEVSLDWKTRYQIALGISRGLTYLHDKCIDCIVHCDIKPENILLNASFVPKIADFGMAKLIGHDFSRVLTMTRGTIGYLAPEWISGGAITAKADVYSYGMMLFEIISGKRNIEKMQGQKMSYFPSLAASKMKEGNVISLVGRNSERVKISEEEVFIVCKVACWCIQDEEDCRPSMSQVVQMLEGVVEVGVPPIPRMLQILAEDPENTDFFSEFFRNAASSNYITPGTKSFSTSSTN